VARPLLFMGSHSSTLSGPAACRVWRAPLRHCACERALSVPLRSKSLVSFLSCGREAGEVKGFVCLGGFKNIRKVFGWQENKIELDETQVCTTHIMDLNHALCMLSLGQASRMHSILEATSC